DLTLHELLEVGGDSRVKLLDVLNRSLHGLVSPPNGRFVLLMTVQPLERGTDSGYGAGQLETGQFGRGGDGKAGTVLAHECRDDRGECREKGCGERHQTVDRHGTVLLSRGSIRLMERPTGAWRSSVLVCSSARP